jgi:peptidoglycan/LPS O-acetylase OafA/YrhL
MTSQITRAPARPEQWPVSGEPARAHVAALTGLRGVAVGLVMALHLWQSAGAPQAWWGAIALHALPACGYLGVDLFFVLSGFLLAQPFLRAAREGWRFPPRLGRYFVHRIRRVVPAYWAQLALLFLILWGVQGAPPYDVRTMVAHALFLHLLVPGVATISGVYWSLPVEWWFYFALPPLALWVARTRGWLVLLVALAVAVTFRIKCLEWGLAGRGGWVFTYGSIMHLSGRIDEFVIGILAARVHLALPADARVRGWAAMIAVAGLLLLAPGLASRGDIFAQADFPWLLVHYPIVATAWAAVILGASGASRVASTLLANRPMIFLGTISYSLYLWHGLSLEAARYLGLYDRLGAAAGAVVASLCAVGVAWLSWRLIERPFQRDRDRAMK